MINKITANVQKTAVKFHTSPSTTEAHPAFECIHNEHTIMNLYNLQYQKSWPKTMPQFYYSVSKYIHYLVFPGHYARGGGHEQHAKRNGHFFSSMLIL